MTDIITANNIWFSYKKNKTDKDTEFILKDISFSLKKGNILGINGESGSGKTTLAKLIAGILIPSRGSLVFNYNNTKDIKANPAQLLFQNSEELINPYRIVKDVLTESIEIKNKHALNTDEILNNILEITGTEKKLLHQKCYELSGGERQKVALARLLAVKPELLILDEPFSAQDVESQLNLLTLFKKINKDEDITVICISHLTNVLKHLTENIITVKDGKIKSGNT
jgi:ATPase components of various ABC-type transport systems, contain duplicated ATPase